jgi:predicted DNA-binding protein
MDSTLTIRLPKKQREVLKELARITGRSESAVVRELIDREARSGFDFDRVRDLAGSLSGGGSAPSNADSWRKQMRDRNWRT